jgi:hypothetical protein
LEDNEKKTIEKFPIFLELGNSSTEKLKKNNKVEMRMGVNSEMENVLNNLKMYENNYNLNNNFGNNSNSDDFNKKKLTCVCKFVKASESSNSKRLLDPNIPKRNEFGFSLNVNNDNKNNEWNQLNLRKQKLFDFPNGTLNLPENLSNIQNKKNINNNKSINKDISKNKKLDLLQKKIISTKEINNKGNIKYNKIKFK